MDAVQDLTSLRNAYASGSLTPTDLVAHIYPKLQSATGAFIHLVDIEALLERCKTLELLPIAERGQLWGIPFAVKDNVDVADLPTTAACPAFKHIPASSSPGVQALVDAGGIVVGKTNLDQFAAGLNGTRSPYGVPANPFDSRFITGGSSSGSAAVVGSGLLPFALGTDTAGSGRVPAGFCGCVGIKATVGSNSIVGVVPACLSLDNLTVLARSVEDAAEIMRLMQAAHLGAADVGRRVPVPVAQPPLPGFTFGVPAACYLDWAGPGGRVVEMQSQACFEQAIARLESVGGKRVDVDFEPFFTVAAMLYGTSFVADRYSGIRKFLEADKPKGVGFADWAAGLVNDKRMLPVTRHILSGAGKYTAADVFDDMATLAALKAKAMAELTKADMLLVPTALAHYTAQEIMEEESGEGGRVPLWTQNSKLGRFTNFVNLLDMCGIAIPSGIISYDAAQPIANGGGESHVMAEEQRRIDHLAATGRTQVTLPFGVTLLAKAWQDEWLWQVAAEMHAASGLGCGPQGHGVVPYTEP